VAANWTKTDGQVAATGSETVSASMATSSNFSPGALDSSLLGSFFEEYMLEVVVHEKSSARVCCTESDEEPRVYVEPS